MTVATTEVSSKTTAIPGLLIFDVSLVQDERGYYQETYQKEKLILSGLPSSFSVVQTNVSYNKKSGVTRGIHAEPWDKYITVIKGKVFAAYVDLRKGPSFGNLVTTYIQPGICIYLPQGVGNSFQTIEDDSYYLYSVNDHWRQELYDEYCFANLADPELNIAWPIPLPKAIISDRDKTHPIVKNAKKFEPKI